MAKHILVIDDEEAVRKAFVYALKGADYEVTTAASGEDGIAQAQARKPELIFLDLRMPGIDGVETLRRLQGCCGEVPLYIVTAFRREYMAALEQAAQDGLQFQVVDKPLDAEQIRAIARVAFGSPEMI